MPISRNALEEGFLRDVLRLVSVAQKVRGGANKSHPVLFDQERERGLVARTHASHPLSLQRGRIDGSETEMSDIKHGDSRGTWCEGRFVHPLKRDFTMKRAFAGRSARRRVK